MDENIKIVQEFYNANVEREWDRIADRPEFLLTCRMLGRYIKPGDSVLDIGGGPGRYSLYLAGKGCDVTLFDLSPENIKFAAERAAEQGLSIKTIAGDAREADKLVAGQFDHVLLMGPMYHLLDETDRITAVNAALNLLKPDGIIFVSFINAFAGMIYYMKHMPDFSADPDSEPFVQDVIAGKSYSGNAFTRAFFMDLKKVLPFMSQFPLEKLHYFGQEGVTSPCEINIMAQDHKVIDLWLNFSEAVWEREEFLSYSEHLMNNKKKIFLKCLEPHNSTNG
jgi:2-polyprenyl-3-methyl-5-hydroxy-6-metoxy-1,4-benzoquinol methylase